MDIQKAKSDPIKILFVDDHDIIRLVMTELLKNSGVPFKVVSNGKEALKCVENDDYNLIISDIMMPEMDGYKLAKNITKWSKANKKTIKLYAFTASRIKDIEENCIRAGFCKVLGKSTVNIDMIQNLTDDFYKN